MSDTEHSSSLKSYVISYVTLLVLMVLSVAAHEFHLPVWLGFAIATVKALVVMIVFMHLNQTTRTSLWVAVGGFFWLGILFLITFSDIATRPVMTLLGK